MNNARKISTPRASLCALGCYLTQQQALDNLKNLSLPQKKGLPCAMGKTDRYARPDFCRRNRDESA
jgi:hypothetical protein